MKLESKIKKLLINYFHNEGVVDYECLTQSERELFSKEEFEDLKKWLFS